MRRSGSYDVLFFTPWIAPVLTPRAGTTAGGAETQIHLLARQIADRGYRVCIATFEAGAPLPARTGKVDVVGAPAHSERGRVTRTLLRAAATIRMLREARARVVVQRAAGSTTGIVGLAARAQRARFVYSSANVIDFDFDELEQNRVILALYRIGIRLADRIVVQTDEQAELCRSRFGREPAVVKSVAEPAAMREQEPDAFLWVGRLAPYKKPLAFVELARAVPEAHFRMVCVPDPAGPSLETLEREAAALPNLDVLGPRPRDELLPLVESAVAVVNTADYEGMPNVFLEAWSRGVPTLALTHDPDGVISSHALGGFAAGSQQRLAALARDLWNGRADQSALAERCRRYIEREHSPRTVTDRWLEALGLPASGALRDRVGASA